MPLRDALGQSAAARFPAGVSTVGIEANRLPVKTPGGRRAGAKVDGQLFADMLPHPAVRSRETQNASGRKLLSRASSSGFGAKPGRQRLGAEDCARPASKARGRSLARYARRQRRRARNGSDPPDPLDGPATVSYEQAACYP